MNKKIMQVVIMVVILGVISYIVYDFKKSSDKEFEERERSSELIEDESGEIVRGEDGVPVEYGAFKGDMVYDYELVDIDTGDIVKISDFRGKKVFLNFWASWCPPCKAEAPHLQEFSEKQDDVIVLGVNVKDSEREEGAEHEFVKEYGLTFTNVYAPEEMYYTFPITSFPTSLFINSDGIIDEGIVGPVDVETLEAKFSEIE